MLLLSALFSALVLAAAVIWGARAISREIAAIRQAAVHVRTLQVMSLFAPGLSAADGDAGALLVWEPLARAARRLFPDEFAALDRAVGSTFPFDRGRIEVAHARWTAVWLAWECAHDAEYKLKAEMIQSDFAASSDSALARSKREAVEREKLELYQRRYAEYVRVGKALQALLD